MDVYHQGGEMDIWLGRRGGVDMNVSRHRENQPRQAPATEAPRVRRTAPGPRGFLTDQEIADLDARLKEIVDSHSRAEARVASIRLS